jgi:hypothetical protein
MANGQTRACSSHQLGFTCLSLLSLSLLPSPGMLQPEVPTFWRKRLSAVVTNSTSHIRVHLVAAFGRIFREDNRLDPDYTRSN